MLAIRGGVPIRNSSWPSWPRSNGETEQRVLRILRSGRWTISGPHVPSPLAEAEFAKQFAAFNGVRYCVPTANGSSALVIALESLDIGPGDEVIVPVLTWVATAAAVLRVNATPVFVDVDEGSLCMSVSAARASITPRTRAFLPVHLHHSMVDMDALLALSQETGIPVIEDTAQAHGAIWRGRKAGTLGRMGTYSFQQSKVLTSGEGGAVITDDSALFERLQQLRADSRCWLESPRPLDGMQLDSPGRLMGANYCLSDIHAAVLLGQLPFLEEQLKTQAGNAEYLDTRLASLPGLRPLRQPSGLERRSVYEYLVQIDPEILKGRSNERFCEALKAETGLAFYRPDPPLHRSPLYQPLTKKRFSYDGQPTDRLNYSNISFPVAEAAQHQGIICHHAAFLGTRADMDDIVAAFDKVLRYVDEL